MKLKYILPVATIASVATIVTPLVTSCGKKWDASWTKGNKYKPMTPKSKTTYSTEDDLTEAYRKDVSSNHKIFSDDMVYHYSLSDETSNLAVDYDISAVSYTTKAVGDKETFTDPEDSKDKNMFRLTFDVKLTANIIIDLTEQGGPKSTLEYKGSFISVTNFPVYCRFQNDNEGIRVSKISDKVWEMNDKDWSITMPEVKLDGTTYEYSLGEDKTYNNTVFKELPSGLQTVVEYFANYLTYNESNYYSKASK